MPLRATSPPTWASEQASPSLPRKPGPDAARSRRPCSAACGLYWLLDDGGLGIERADVGFWRDFLARRRRFIAEVLAKLRSPARPRRTRSARCWAHRDSRPRCPRGRRPAVPRRGRGVRPAPVDLGLGDRTEPAGRPDVAHAPVQLARVEPEPLLPAPAPAGRGCDLQYATDVEEDRPYRLSTPAPVRRRRVPPRRTRPRRRSVPPG
jgi:hypothetical protein